MLTWNNLIRTSAIILASSALAGCGTRPNAQVSLADSAAATKQSHSTESDLAAEASPPVAEEPSVAAPTYYQDAAVIFRKRCEVCHREGEAAPFPLTTYAETAPRAAQIADVVASRFMPPWQPAPDGPHYQRSQSLTTKEIDLLTRWAKTGAQEGDPHNPPPPANFPKGWQLGTPDLVLTMEGTYKLKPEGADVYRSFVLKAPIDRPRWVKAIEFRPGNYRVAHHAFIYVDRTGRCRQLDEADEAPGFETMDATTDGAEKPVAQLLSWQVGRLPSPPQPGIAWRLEPGDDMVIELHMQTSGKEEDVQLSLGMFFTDEPPTRHPYILSLVQQEIDIAPGDKNYRVRNEYVVSKDVQALAVLGHAHYLAKQVHAYAILPSGAKEWLLKIDDWDFSWQSDYEFEQPVPLPRGSRIVQDFLFDNSADNPRNPSSPPRRVKFGKQTVDEMAELHLQVECSSASDLADLRKDYKKWRLDMILNRYQSRLAKDPNNVAALFELGKAEFTMGRLKGADQLFTRAATLEPTNADIAYYQGYASMTGRDYTSAIAHFERALSLAPDHYRARSSIGKALMDTGRRQEAIAEFEKALALNPHDPFAHQALGICLAQETRLQEALTHFKTAYQLKPELSAAKQNAERIEAMLAAPNSGS